MDDGHVTRLVRSWCNMRGQLPSSLFQLSSLKELVLHGNKLSGTVPESIGQLSNLEKLGLGGNEFTGRLPVSDLLKLSQLSTMLIHNNHFELPAGITNDRWGGGLWIRDDQKAINDLLQQLRESGRRRRRRRRR